MALVALPLCLCAPILVSVEETRPWPPLGGGRPAAALRFWRSCACHWTCYYVTEATASLMPVSFQRYPGTSASVAVLLHVKTACLLTPHTRWPFACRRSLRGHLRAAHLSGSSPLAMVSVVSRWDPPKALTLPRRAEP